MSDLPNKNLYVTIAAAAKMLGVSIDTVRRWDAQGTLHSTRLDGKNRFFLKSELKSFRKSKPLSISEAATALSVSVSTLRRLEKRGVVIADRAASGERMYSPEKIREILDSRKKGRQAGVNLFAPIPTNLHAVNNPQVETTEEGTKEYNSEASAYASPAQGAGNFWKKNHIVRHVGQLNAVGSYMGSGAKSIRFGHQPVEYKKGVAILSFLLLLSTGIFAFTVLRDVVNPKKQAFVPTPAGLGALSYLSPQQRAEMAQAQVLAASTVKGKFTVNIASEFNEDITVNNKNLTLGTGKLTASNVIYSITAGQGIQITPGQNPTISSSGVDSFSTVAVGSTDLTAGTNDTLTFTSGSPCTRNG